MSYMRVIPVALATLGACAIAEDETIEQPVVVLGSPPLGPSATGSIPALPSLAPAGGTVPAGVVGGIYTNGRDLNAPPSTDLAPWRTSLTSDAFSTRAALGPFLDGAIGAADARASEVSEADVDAALAAIHVVGGAGGFTSFTRRAGWKPVQARWTSEQRSCLGPTPCTMSTSSAPDPGHFAELRRRGARLYCAAREAAFRQPGTGVIMGAQSAGGFELFGEPLEFLVIEPTVVMGAPQKFVDRATNDGAQAFAVPLSVGTRLTPIRGLGLDGLPELRTPVTLIAADAEVANRANRVAPPLVAPYFANTHHSVTFGEGVVSSGWQAHADLPKIPLFSVMVLEARLDIGFDVGAGAATPLKTALLAGAPLAFAPPRLGSPPYLYEPFGATAYYDGNWTLGTTTPGTAPVSALAGVVPGSLAAANPFLVKAIQDTDVGVDVRTSASMSALLEVAGGVNTGVLGIQLVVSGGLSVTGSMIHEVRDAQRAALSSSTNPPLAPLSGVVVTPTMEGKLELISRAYLEISLFFWNWTIDIYDFTPPHAGLTIASHRDDPWPEASRFRIGTGSDRGNITSQPAVSSHYPGRPEFPSFPVNVDACLAEDREVPRTPPRCTSVPDPARAPHSELCVYSAFNAPAPFCADIAATARFVGTTAAQRTCATDLLTFLCRSTSREQTHAGQPVVARVIENTVAFGNELGAIANACGASFSPAWVQSTIGFGLCNASATLLAPGTAVTPLPVRGPTAPGTCL